MLDPTTLISIYDFARWFSAAKTRNIVVLLDVCHSGGVGAALQHFKPKLDAGPNYFFIGAARQGQDTTQSSKLQHGWFTHCLLRAFMQPPTADGWLTISQILTFVSDEIKWFAKDQPMPIQSSSFSVNLNLPLLRNPQYPELSPVPPLWHVPWKRNIFFTGQEDLLSQLEYRLQHEQETALTQPHALSGLGGIGKTQLALEYAYRHRQDYHAILWGRADTYEALLSTFINIAHLLDLPEKDEQDQKIIVEAVKTWLQGRSQWLFVLDNVEDLALVQEFLPPAFGGHLLLTTRIQAMGKDAKKQLEVKPMLPEIGAQFLLRRARMLAAETRLEEAPEEEVTRAKELAEELGGLPLAIDQAGAYMEETKCGLTRYQRLYQTQRAKLLARRGGRQDRQGRSVDDHPESVIITWSVSFERLTQRNPAAAELLQFCAFLAPDAIPEELLSRGAGELGETLAPVAADAYAVDQAIAALGAYSFISRNRQTEMLSIHRLVQAVLQDFLSPEERRLWAKRASMALNAVFPQVEHGTWSQCERLLPQALAGAQSIELYQINVKEAGRLLHETASYLQDRARYAEAEPLYQRALRIREQQLGPEHPDVAQSLNGLANLYWQQGKYEEAEP
ncbi:MAG TPA: tetratricopeptide repeat protein, partial [Ktedonobacteraceae bacterium]